MRSRVYFITVDVHGLYYNVVSQSKLNGHLTQSLIVYIFICDDLFNVRKEKAANCCPFKLNKGLLCNLQQINCTNITIMVGPSRPNVVDLLSTQQSTQVISKDK